MPIQMTTPIAEIEAYINERKARLNKQISRVLCFVGEECRNEAIRRHKYINRTGNLESSTGYVVIMDGNIIQYGGFKGEAKHDAQGAAEGRALAAELAAEHKTGAVLVVVAGKHYAKYVADKGLDVLDSAELTAERLIPEMMDTLVI